MTAKKKSTKNNNDDTASVIDFETTLDQLESLVEQMETGELSLEASLEAFERGVKMTRDCQSALKRAELRIQVLNNENSETDVFDEQED
ncbi:MAG: exodeoxyribonuclease VII small subunit [Pseudomonadales bacterium]|nr:exodeoxyribonuclease VII small subunit [Pseudomonadales bacterium]